MVQNGMVSWYGQMHLENHSQSFLHGPSFHPAGFTIFLWCASDSFHMLWRWKLASIINDCLPCLILGLDVKMHQDYCLGCKLYCKKLTECNQSILGCTMSTLRCTQWQIIDKSHTDAKCRIIASCIKLSRCSTLIISLDAKISWFHMHS